MERRQRRPRTEHILPQRRLYIRHPNAIEHAANLPAGSAQCPDGNIGRRYSIRLSQRCAGHKSNGEYTHRQAGGSRRHAHNHILLHAKRQPARRNRHADGYGNGDGYSNRHGNAYGDGNRHAYANSDGYRYTHADGYGNCHAYRHRDGYTYSNRDCNCNADGYTYRYAHRHGNGYTYIDRNGHAHAYANRYANAYSHA